MKSDFNVFVAGSINIEEERSTCRSVCNSLQNQWGTINTKSFEDFPEVISKKGHQNEYNSFIGEADLVIFIFSSTVGEITLSEFRYAYQAFRQNGYPKILIYFDKQFDSDEVLVFKEELSNKGQYYLEYNGLTDLKVQFEKHLTKILINKFKRSSSPFQEVLHYIGIPLYCVAIWLIMSIIGGIGMYIYDSLMSEAECLSLAVDYMEYGPKGKLMYYFPDATFVYDLNNNNLDIIPRRHKMLSSDISFNKVKKFTYTTAATMLITRVVKVTPSGNAKSKLAYIAAVSAGLVGLGAGCVVEQMLFPPQYSKQMRKYLSEPSNWETIKMNRGASHWF